MKIFERNIRGRRKGHKLSNRQLELVENLLPALRIDPLEKSRLEPDKLFPILTEDLWLEIGFGAGEHLIAQSMKHTSIGFIGCEPFVNGVAKVLSAVEDNQLKNIRIYDDDARHVLSALPEASIGRVFILFPDPWPKKRHHKRRFISTEVVDQLARITKPKAEVRIASDIGDYIKSTLLVFSNNQEFSWIDLGPVDWRSRSPDWPETRYERKALSEGRQPVYLRFVRNI